MLCATAARPQIAAARATALIKQRKQAKARAAATVRAAVRRPLGKLKDEEITKHIPKRYRATVMDFLRWTRRSASMPQRMVTFDCDILRYADELWAEGHHKAVLHGTWCGLTPLAPSIKVHLHGRRRLFVA